MPVEPFVVRWASCIIATTIFVLTVNVMLLTISTTHEPATDLGLEIDLVTHDARKFFSLMLKKNGYVLEQLLSPLIVMTTPEHEELRTELERAFKESCLPENPSGAALNELLIRLRTGDRK